MSIGISLVRVAKQPGMQTRRSVRLCTATLLLALVGCENSGTAPSTTMPAAAPVGRSPGFIAFVGAGEHDPLWPILQKSALDYAAQFSRVEIRYLTPPGDSPRDQIDLIRGLRDNQMLGMCVQVSDPIALRGALGEVESRGVPIVPMIHAPPGSHPVGFSGLDDQAIGTELADNTARILKGSGTIMLLTAGADDPVYGPRLKAFNKEIEKHSSIEIFTRQDCHGDGLLARQLMRERTERFPRLSAWVSLGDWPTRGLNHDADLGLPAECKLILPGGWPAQWFLLESGRCPVMVACDYHEIGAHALQYCENTIRKPSAFLARYVAPTRIIEPASLNAYIVDWNRWSGTK